MCVINKISCVLLVKLECVLLTRLEVDLVNKFSSVPTYLIRNLGSVS